MKKKVTIYLLIIVGFVGMIIFGVFINKDKNISSLPVVDGTTTSNDVIDMPKNIIFKRNAAESNDGSSITVKCTIVPNDALNKEVIWTSSWVSQNSDNVSNYVSLNVSSDTLSCTITVIKGFSSQINVTATSADSPSVYKTCVLDYYKRHNIIESSFSTIVECESYDSSQARATMGSMFASRYQAGTLNDMQIYSTEDIETNYVGTTGSSYIQAEIEYQFSEAFVNNFKNYKPDTTLSATKRYTSTGDKVSESFEEFFGEIWGEYSSAPANFLKAMRGVETVFTFYITFKVISSDKYVFNTYNYSCAVGGANVDSLFRVTDIALETNTYTFY